MLHRVLKRKGVKTENKKKVLEKGKNDIMSKIQFAGNVY